MLCVLYFRDCVILLCNCCIWFLYLFYRKCISYVDYILCMYYLSFLLWCNGKIVSTNYTLVSYKLKICFLLLSYQSNSFDLKCMFITMHDFSVHVSNDFSTTVIWKKCVTTVKSIRNGAFFFLSEIYILFISCFCVSKMLKCKLISTRHTRGSLVDDTYAQGDVYMCSVEAILWTVVVILCKLSLACQLVWHVGVTHELITLY